MHREHLQNPVHRKVKLSEAGKLEEEEEEEGEEEEAEEGEVSVACP